MPENAQNAQSSNSERRDQDPWELARRLTRDDVPDAKAAIAGAQAIIAEEVANEPEARRFVRGTLRKHGKLTVKKRVEVTAVSLDRKRNRIGLSMRD